MDPNIADYAGWTPLVILLNYEEKKKKKNLFLIKSMKHVEMDRLIY